MGIQVASDDAELSQECYMFPHNGQSLLSRNINRKKNL